MDRFLEAALAGLAGILIGGFFFGGLWWTVRKGLTSSRPTLLFTASLLLRSGVALVGFYFVCDKQWERMFAALFGFIVARAIVAGLTRNKRPEILKKE